MHAYGKYLVHEQASGHGTLVIAYMYADVQTKCVDSSKNAIFTQNFAWNVMIELFSTGFSERKISVQRLSYKNKLDHNQRVKINRWTLQS